MMGVLTPKLVKDHFIADKPLLLAKTSAVYHHLNYCKAEWLAYSLDTVYQWLRNHKPLKLEESLPVYQLCIELGW
jgi:hypothetical protein